LSDRNKLVKEKLESLGLEIEATTISMSDVNELMLAPATQLITLNDEGVRYLAGKPSGTISLGDLSGKTNDWVETGGEFLWKDSIPGSSWDDYTIGEIYDISNDGTFDTGNKYTRYVQYCDDDDWCYDDYDLYAVPVKRVNV
jgi:hypothetical protein